MPWLGWCLSCNQKTAPACHLGSQVLVVSNYLSKLNMLEVSAGTVWQLKYTGYIFGHGTITFGNFIPKSVLGGESLKKSTAYPMALWASLPSLAKLVHQGRRLRRCGIPGHASCAMPQQGSAVSQTARAARGFLGQCSVAKPSQQLPVPVGRWKQPWGSCSSGESARHVTVSQDALAPHLSLSPVLRHY